MDEPTDLPTGQPTEEELAACEGAGYIDPVTDPRARRIAELSPLVADPPEDWSTEPTPRDQAAIDAGNGGESG